MTKIIYNLLLFFSLFAIVCCVSDINYVRAVNSNIPQIRYKAGLYGQIKNNYGGILEKYKQQQNKISTLQNDIRRLQKNNIELLEDNISLQNTIKFTANRGNKPINFINPPVITSRGYYSANFLGQFRITAYTPSPKECGNNLGITSSGQPIIAGYSVAVDNKFWPMGTIFYIKGIGYVKAMDTGGMINGRNRLDLAVFDRKNAINFGVRNMDVYLVKYGKQ